MPLSERAYSAQLRKDLTISYSHDIHINLLPDMRRTGKKPYDFYFLYLGCFCAIECKIVHGKSFNVANDVRPHQPMFLREVIDCFGFGFFVIGFNKYKKSFILSPDNLEYIEERCCSDRIGFNDFEKYFDAMSFTRKKIDGKTRWEVEKIIHVIETIRSRERIQ